MLCLFCYNLIMIHIYSFAHKNVLIDSVYPDVHNFCAAYRTDNQPDFSVHTRQSDIDYERSKSEGDFSDAWLEVSAVYRKIAEHMPFYNTVLIHGSALSVDGQGYLFTAPSGTGKSTHSSLWRKLLGGRVVMINDDKPLVRVEESATIYGTPYCGKEGLNTKISVNLKAIYLLERSEESHIQEISAHEAYPELLRQTYRPHYKPAFAKTLVLLDKLSELVKFYRLGCNMSLSAAELAYNTMKGDS